MNKVPVLSGLLVIAVLMGGCADHGSEFHGSGYAEGVERYDCGATALLVGSTRGESGEVDVYVYDGAGHRVLDPTYAWFTGSVSEAVSGKEGRWKVEWETSDDWKGELEFLLEC